MLPQLKQDMTWESLGQLLRERGLIDKQTMTVVKSEKDTAAGLTLTFRLTIALSDSARTPVMVMTYAEASELLLLVGVSPETTFDCPMSHLVNPESHTLNLTVNSHFPHKEVMGT